MGEGCREMKGDELALEMERIKSCEVVNGCIGGILSVRFALNFDNDG